MNKSSTKELTLQTTSLYSLRLGPHFLRIMAVWTGVSVIQTICTKRVTEDNNTILYFLLHYICLTAVVTFQIKILHKTMNEFWA